MLEMCCCLLQCTRLKYCESVAARLSIHKAMFHVAHAAIFDWLEPPPHTAHFIYIYIEREREGEIYSPSFIMHIHIVQR